MRRFVLVRSADPSGVSGLGTVAEGVEFSDGTAVIRWTVALVSTGIYADVETLMRVHGHGSVTLLKWLDQAEDAA